MRDDFSPKIKQLVASRVAFHCSNPECRAGTSGPQSDPSKSLNIGVAAHITAASLGGPRYDPGLSTNERKHFSNAIWLCQNCAKLVDSDVAKYSIAQLRQWKQQAEADAQKLLGQRRRKATLTEKDTIGVASTHVKRELALKKRMQKDFLKRPGWFKGGSPPRPYQKFSHTRAIIRSVEDQLYPDIDETKKISGWFKVEMWDFYHNGLEVIIGMKAGIIDKKHRWSLINYSDPFDATQFTRIKVWVIGRIPWKNIEVYDVGGDEYYNFPHIYCRFTNDGSPFEDIIHRKVADEDGIDYDSFLEPDLMFEFKREE